MSKTTIKNLNINWLFIKDGCMATIGKKAGKEPNQAWKRKLLICQHSPIRRGVVSWEWNDIPFCNMGHFVRHHVGCTPYVRTSREDRTGVPRDQRTQTEPVSMQMDANIQSLIDMAEKRLCMCSDVTTRAYMMDLKEAIAEYDEDVAWALVPSCVRCGGCIEGFGDCKFYQNLMKDATLEDQMNIQRRYDIYDEKIKKLKK